MSLTNRAYVITKSEGLTFVLSISASYNKEGGVSSLESQLFRRLSQEVHKCTARLDYIAEYNVYVNNK